MSFKVIINKSAIKDIATAIEYYEKQSDGLGNKFKTIRIYAILNTKLNPNIWQNRTK